MGASPTCRWTSASGVAWCGVQLSRTPPRAHTRALSAWRAADGDPVERVSEINQGLYRTLVAPAVRASVTEPVAEAMRAMHPNRLRFAMYSDANPFMQPVKALAESVRAARQPVAEGVPTPVPMQSILRK